MGKIERVEVPADDRKRLPRLVRDRNTPPKVVWRARIVLLAGDANVAFWTRRTPGPWPPVESSRSAIRTS